ncbi:MAG: hypothetical protein E7649_04950, partial [Ruminococcaceae bacterium]|nr:hypothetical protein [Oscillospiraceae bacterium]
MRKKDEIKLDALSMIDDDIIDKNTEKRAKLMGKKRFPKWIIPSGAAVAAVIAIAIIVPMLLTMLTTKQVPIYEGMSVLDNYNGASSAKATEPQSQEYRFDFLSASKGNDNGNHNGHNKKPVEDIVKDDESISLTVPEQKMYYAQPNQDIYINVHISNPDSFEILSFTLNGKKYSSYMFENGSDLENLILKVNVGELAGVREYTIDAIKYVDGQEIKDVVMEGDRTVKVGVYSDGIQPSASITDELVAINEVSFKISI